MKAYVEQLSHFWPFPIECSVGRSWCGARERLELRRSSPRKRGLDLALCKGPTARAILQHCFFVASCKRFSACSRRYLTACSVFGAGGLRMQVPRLWSGNTMCERNLALLNRCLEQALSVVFWQEGFSIITVARTEIRTNFYTNG